MLRKFALLSLLVATLSVGFLTGCESTNSKSYGLSGDNQPRHVNDKGRVIYNQ